MLLLRWWMLLLLLFWLMLWLMLMLMLLLWRKRRLLMLEVRVMLLLRVSVGIDRWRRLILLVKIVRMDTLSPVLVRVVSRVHERIVVDGSWSRVVPVIESSGILIGLLVSWRQVPKLVRVALLKMRRRRLCPRVPLIVVPARRRRCCCCSRRCLTPVQVAP